MENEILKRIYINKPASLEKKFFFHYVLFILVLLLLNSNCTAGANKPVADGSFIQAGLCGSWNDARWQKEFSVMKEAGMHYLIIGAVAESAEGKTAKTLYPSKLPNTELSKMVKGKDMVDICLRNAEVAGIKVFIGIGMNDKWWKAPGIDSTWLYNQMEFDNKVADEVWAKYRKKYPSAFYGWYWVYEVANVNLTALQQEVLIRAMNMQLDHLILKNEKLPFLWCPFMRSEFGTPDAYKIMWENVLAGIHTTEGDIFAPQDCVGARGIKLDEAAAWFAALREAAITKPGLKFWSDVETFDQLDWTSATIGRIVAQMKLEQPYVENFITFSYNHYQSPDNADPGFHKTYLDYLKNGRLETIPPSTPSKLSASLQSGSGISLSWSASSDNIGVCGYYIYRDGIKIAKRQEKRRHGGRSADFDVTGYVDKGLNNGSYTYQVQAFDFADNVSALSKPVKIILPAKETDSK